jgi:hypothetical protein
VAGIRPATPGYKTVEIEPALGKLTSIKGQMSHTAGIISFDLKRVGTQGISGAIILPKGLTGNFKWNGKSIALKRENKY